MKSPRPDTPRYTLREARDDEYDALCRLWAQADRFHAEIQPQFFRYSPEWRRPREELQRLLQNPQQKIFVAEGHPPRLLGMVSVRVYDTPAHPIMCPCRRGYVEDLVVEEQCRQQGIGRALMERAIAWCQGQGAEQVLLTIWQENAVAEVFYARLGFQTVNRVLGYKIAAGDEMEERNIER
jgi:ribosomal protein S18 acetylase RimI-like enzyme